MNKIQDKYILQKRLVSTVIGLVIVWGVFTFLVYPNLNLIRITLFQDGIFDFTAVKTLLASSRARESFVNSIILGVSLATTVSVLGIFQILCLDYYEIKGRKWLNIAYYSPLVCNGMVLVLAWNFIFGTQGFVTANLLEIIPDFNTAWFKGFWVVLFVMSFAGTTTYVMFVRAALKSVDFQTIEAAQNMGVKSHKILMKVVLPVLKPSIFAAAILAFNSGMSAFGTPSVLGGEFETLNALIFSFSNTLTTRNYAAILAVFLGLITMTILLVFNHIERKKKYHSVSKVKTPLKRQKIKNPVACAVVTIIAHIIAIIQTVPLAFIILFSFMPVVDMHNGVINFKNFSFQNYQAVFSSSSGITPIIVSIIYSTMAAFIVVMIILYLARIITSKNTKLTYALELSLQIPWFLPATLIALGLLMTFSAPNLLVFGNVMSGTLYLILIGYIIAKVPFTLRMLRASYLNIDSSLEDAAKNLGASPIKAYFRVLFPILLPSAMSVGLLNFISLLSEYNISAFLYHPLYQPLGISIRSTTSEMATPEAQMRSFVYAVIIMVISMIVVKITNKKTVDSDE